MKRLTITLIILILCFTAFALKQRGYVRTITRPNYVGQTLPGVNLRAKGKSNGVVTDENGNFEFVFDGLQNGEPYAFTAIIKAGYELQEKEVIGRSQPCSEHVPVEILMVSREQLARERMMIEEKARQNLEQAYLQKLNSLDSALQNHLIAEQDYMSQVDELNEKYGKYEPLINAMADRYARTDYAKMDSLTYLINQAIESGDIDIAESLLHQKGNMAERESDILSRKEAEDHADSLLNRERQALDSTKSETRKRLRELADDYYHMYTIFLTRFDNDSARYYILRRAELDSSNVEYQLQAAQYLLVFTMEYSLAIQYDERALRNSIKQNGSLYGDVATAYNDMGISYMSMHKLNEAEDYMNKSLEIREALNGKKDKSIAESYNNIGRIYYERGDFDMAQKYFQKAIRIRNSLTGGENSYELAKCELNLAIVYTKQGKYDKTIDLLGKALPQLIIHDGENSTEVANCHNSLGAVYYYMKDYTSSIRHFEKALNIFRQIKGEKHSQTKQVEANLRTVQGIASGK